MGESILSRPVAWRRCAVLQLLAQALAVSFGRTCISCASDANLADATVDASSYVDEATACASLARADASLPSSSARVCASAAALATCAQPHPTPR